MRRGQGAGGHFLLVAWQRLCASSNGCRSCRQHYQISLTRTPAPPRPAAAAKALKGMEAQLQGTVRLLFQPAEESSGGAARMIGEGAPEGVAAAFGLHVDPASPTGVISAKASNQGAWQAGCCGWQRVEQRKRCRAVASMLQSHSGSALPCIICYTLVWALSCVPLSCVLLSCVLLSCVLPLIALLLPSPSTQLPVHASPALAPQPGATFAASIASP